MTEAMELHVASKSFLKFLSNKDYAYFNDTRYNIFNDWINATEIRLAHFASIIWVLNTIKTMQTTADAKKLETIKNFIT